MHPGQLAISPETVRELVDAQFPPWRTPAIRPADSAGTVNAIFRIGDHLAARLPLESGDPGTARRHLESEARAASELAGRTQFRTPEPVALGEPGVGYPLPWLVQTWAARYHRHRTGLGRIRRVRTGPGRVHQRGARHQHGRPDVPRVRPRRRPGLPRRPDAKLFLPQRPARGRSAASPHVGHLPGTAAQRARDVMSHGDLIPGNVLVSDGRLAGVLDVGGLGPADPALDLVAAWHLLEPGPRQVLRDDLRCDDLEWERGKAWAFEQAMGAIWYYADSNIAMSRMGQRTLERIRQTHRQPGPDQTQRRPGLPAPDPPYCAAAGPDSYQVAGRPDMDILRGEPGGLGSLVSPGSGRSPVGGRVCRASRPWASAKSPGTGVRSILLMAAGF